MKTLTLQYPDNLFTDATIDDGQVSSRLRLMAALKMFEIGQLSSGKAAELAGLSRTQFFDACGKYRVSVVGVSAGSGIADLEADMRVALEATK